jgi:ankyrin repeat protein
VETQDDSPKKKPLAMCERHGLSYNSAHYTGCVLCRKLEEAKYTQLSSANSADMRATLGEKPSRWRVTKSFFKTGVRLFLLAVIVKVAVHILDTRQVVTMVVEPAPQTLENMTAPLVEALKFHPSSGLPEPVAGSRDWENTKSMYVAAANGSGAAIKRLLAAGASIDQVENSKSTPLRLAIDNNHIPLAKWLVEKGADVKLAGAILAAARAGDPELLENMLARGADVNEKVTDWEGVKQTPMLLAVESSHIECADVLARHGASLKETYARASGLLEVAARGADGRSAYMVEWLFARGAEPRPRDTELYQPLKVAVAHRSLDVIQVLALRGVNIDAVETEGYGAHETLLTRAARQTGTGTQDTQLQLGLIRKLLLVGARPGPALEDFSLCEGCPRRLGHEIIRSAAARPTLAALDHLDDGGNGALHWAAGFGEPALVEHILRQKTNVNRTSHAGGELSWEYDTGSTPLHLAAAYRHGDVVEKLLANGADPNIPDGKGRKARDVVGTFSSRRYPNTWDSAANQGREMRIKALFDSHMPRLTE